MLVKTARIFDLSVYKSKNYLFMDSGNASFHQVKNECQ